MTTIVPGVIVTMAVVAGFFARNASFITKLITNDDGGKTERLQVVMDMDECMLCSEESIGKANFIERPNLDTITISVL